MLVQAHGFAVDRGVASHVHVELDTRGGLPGFSVIGLTASEARDARERVQAAVLNSGFMFPRRRLTANLAPAAPPKCGPAFDLVLACCILAVQEEIDASRLRRVGLFAALGLGGDLRPCPCAGAVAEVAGQAGLAGLVVARADIGEARAGGIRSAAGLRSLREVAALLAGPSGQGGPSRRGEEAA
jgi:magnesium chelatase family protein